MKIIFVLILLIVVALGLVLVKGLEKEPSPQIIGGDKDEGGCLIGAGYSWCEAKQKCLRVWEEACDANYKKI